MPTFRERYDAGERRAVWDELHALGPLGAVSTDVRADAEMVAVRTIERAVINLAQIHRRLVGLGFEFQLPEYAFVDAGASHAAALRALERKVGAVPATLRALFRAVGEVSFRGWLPSWGSADEWYAQLLDPFEFLADVQSEIERVEDEEAPEDERDFRLPIAGDYLHKNDVSGGAPTVVPLPSDEADARVIEDDGVWFKEYMAKVRELGSRAEALVNVPQPPDEPIWLVDYLRLYFDGGGFRRVAGTEAYPEELVQTLAEGLLEI